MGKAGSICHFSRALPASIWGHCSQVQGFATFEAHTETLFVHIFQHLGILEPPNTVKQVKTQSDKSSLFHPPTCMVLSCQRLSDSDLFSAAFLLCPSIKEGHLLTPSCQRLLRTSDFTGGIRKLLFYQCKVW